ncbi:het domain-containing protein [Colletotrichum plurivorum]|uniref:Het domain-containing protein n=1 Tax=Colletotrichum plurivorum TaxID=2175906 RepID=A0A8H6N560_9PEZI|nr:het domain-containing protein [Colletotrichum plurivorum]
MRLLNTSKLELTEFLLGVPSYAILSHTWFEDEVLFQDITGTRGTKAPNAKAGWGKVRAACELARTLGYEWIWIDTCCIDKSSSAELSEAINSMFRWYSNAAICIAYLADVPLRTAKVSDAFVTDSRWFTRGWTLQELLAPADLDFYSADWARLGSRAHFAAAIEERTQIDAGFLKVPSISLSAASVAERMCWASGRQTTRVEDRAYSLLGIFGVNMPLIYGEGDRAFRRLQEEILRKIDDDSIFAWGTAPVERVPPVLSRLEPGQPLLADSPSWFAYSGDIVPFSTPDLSTRRNRFQDKGVMLATPLWNPAGSSGRAQSLNLAEEPLYLGPLRCRRKKDFFDCIAISLRSSYTEEEQLNRLEGRGNRYSSCFRLCGGLFLAPRTMWTRYSVCTPFVPFDRPPSLATVAVMGDDKAFLERGYAITEVYSASWGYREMPILFPYTIIQASQTWDLSEPVVVRLQERLDGQGPRAPGIALVLQFRYDDPFGDQPQLFPMHPRRTKNRAVRIPEDRTLKDIADVVPKKSRHDDEPVHTGEPDGGGGGGHAAAVRTDLSRTPAAPPMELEIWDKFKLSVTTEPSDRRRHQFFPRFR